MAAEAAIRRARDAVWCGGREDGTVIVIDLDDYSDDDDGETPNEHQRQGPNDAPPTTNIVKSEPVKRTKSEPGATGTTKRTKGEPDPVVITTSSSSSSGAITAPINPPRTDNAGANRSSRVVIDLLSDDDDEAIATPPPAVLFVCGPSGCGKTTVAEAVSRQLRWTCVDADGLHSAANIAKMSRGVPLTDTDRWPWLDAVAARCAALAAAAAGGDGGARGVVCACSALRKVYRDRLLAQCGATVRFAFLGADRDTCLQRMQARTGHFMPAGLVDSQFAARELPGPGELPHARVIPDGDVASVVAAVARFVGTGGQPDCIVID
jgi:gluconokinase